MTEGYVLIASGPDKFFEMTVCLVASLRYHGDNRPVMVVTDNVSHPLLVKYVSLFCEVVDQIKWAADLSVEFGVEIGGAYERGGIPAFMLYNISPFDRTISFDSDCMIVSNTDRLWNVFDNYHITFLGSSRAYPGWGSMTHEDIMNAEIQIEDDLRAEGKNIRFSLREVHGGVMWWDKSKDTKRFVDNLLIAIKHKRLLGYFKKVVDMWGGILSNEPVLCYVMSLLNYPVIPYNSNIMGVNPNYFCVERGEGDMGHFMTNPLLMGHVPFVDSIPIIVHFFAKDKDINYIWNRNFLLNWLKQNKFELECEYVPPV